MGTLPTVSGAPSNRKLEKRRCVQDKNMNLALCFFGAADPRLKLVPSQHARNHALRVAKAQASNEARLYHTATRLRVYCHLVCNWPHLLGEACHGVRSLLVQHCLEVYTLLSLRKMTQTHTHTPTHTNTHTHTHSLARSLARYDGSNEI